MKKIKILHLVNQLGLDGTSKVVLNLCHLFDDEEYEINVISLSNHVPLASQTGWPQNVKVFTFDYFYDPDYSLKRYFELGFIPSITKNRAKTIIKKIRDENPDVLHCHLQPRELLIAILSAKGLKTRLLYTDHLVRLSKEQPSKIKLRLLATVYRHLYKKFALVAVSKEVLECQRSFNLVGKSQIQRLIENKIDTKKFKPAAKAERNNDRLTIVYVARLSEVKGHKTLIEAVEQLNSSINLQVQLIGGGEMQEEIQELIDSRNLNDVISVLGDINEVGIYLKEADIAAFPSYREGLPLALLEKMASALPVVVSDIPELKSIVRDNENGLLFKVGDSNDLKVQLMKLITDGKLRDRLGNAARKFAVSNYDHTSLKLEYEQLYKNVLGTMH